MAGQFRMALTRAKVTITPPDGPERVEDQVTATVRDGVARLKRHAAQVAEMPATDLVRASSRNFTITGPDGTVWHVVKDCNCTGSR